MKHWFLVWCCAWVVVTGHAQTLTVMDSLQNKPLKGALISSDRVGETVITDELGQADISAFTQASKIIIQYIGYHNYKSSYKQLQAADFQVALQPISLNLDQIVVSATRWRQSSGRVPAKITSITAEEVQLQNPQTAADLLALSGQVFVQKSQQGGGSPMIRGFATNRLLYTVDGVRMNSAIFRGGNIQNVINLDPFATESTEVLFGPNSLIYGSDAIGGTMSFQTLTPELSQYDEALVQGKAVARYATANNERTGHVDINIGWKKWALVTSFSTWDFDHLRQGSHGPEDYIKPVYVQRQDDTDVVITQDDPLLQRPSAYAQTNLMQKVRFKPNNAWDINYGFHYSTTTPYGRYDRHNRYRNGTLRYGEWNYGPQSWMMNNLQINHTASQPLYDELSLRVAHQRFEESRINRDFNDDLRSTQTENVQAYSLNIDAIKSTSPKNTLFYGVEYVLNDVNSEGRLENIVTDIENVGPSRYPQSQWQSLGIYINNDLQVSESFILQAGLRYNQFKLDSDFSNNIAFFPFDFTQASVDNGALTGSIGMVFRPDQSWVFKSNIGTAFRSPNVDDIGKVFDSEPGAVTVPNPGLEAEYAYNFDLSVAKVISEKVKIEATGFYTILDNAMVRRPFEIGGLDSIQFAGQLSQVQALQNAASAHVYGIQAGFEAKIASGFSLISDINYQVGEEELDDGTSGPSRHAAPLFGVTRLRYRNPKLSLECNVNFQGERSYDDLSFGERRKDEIYAQDENGLNYAPAWYTLNLKAQVQLSPSSSISGGIENITDQRYRPYSSGISGAGRNFILSIHTTF